MRDREFGYQEIRKVQSSFGSFRSRPALDGNGSGLRSTRANKRAIAILLVAIWIAAPQEGAAEDFRCGKGSISKHYLPAAHRFWGLAMSEEKPQTTSREEMIVYVERHAPESGSTGGEFYYHSNLGSGTVEMHTWKLVSNKTEPTEILAGLLGYSSRLGARGLQNLVDYTMFYINEEAMLGPHAFPTSKLGRYTVVSFQPGEFKPTIVKRVYRRLKVEVESGGPSECADPKNQAKPECKNRGKQQ